MKSTEAFIAGASDYFNYQPTKTALQTFFYPVSTGHFIYEPGYRQQRSSYDSFLVLYILSGKLEVDTCGSLRTADKDSFLLLDCYQPHGYAANSGCECLWLHFDGPLARSYCGLIWASLGSIFTLQDPRHAIQTLQQVYHTFLDNEPIREAQLSRQITDILTCMLLDTPPKKENRPEPASFTEALLSYINEHFMEKITVEELAARAMLSPYHFIRTFKKETGFTPHEYLLRTRLGAAKYLLRTTAMPIKDICFACGFSSESVFCCAFKKHTGTTPAAYRQA